MKKFSKCNEKLASYLIFTQILKLLAAISDSDASLADISTDADASDISLADISTATSEQSEISLADISTDEVHWLVCFKAFLKLHSCAWVKLYVKTPNIVQRRCESEKMANYLKGGCSLAKYDIKNRI